MRLLLFNLATDRDDPVLGFAAAWAAALARRAESVDVLTMRAGRLDLPPNVRVHSLGKERGRSVPARVLAFYATLGRLLLRGRPDACFSHMQPAFTVMGAPLLLARRVPVVTWYAHPSLTWELRLAHAVSARMVTSVATAYPWRRDKLEVVGQGIDTGVFSPGPAPPEGPPVVLCAGRVSPVKDHGTLLRAAASLRRSRPDLDFRVVVVGGPAREADLAHVEGLRALAAELGLGEVVVFAGPVGTGELVGWYRRCLVHVNLTPTGFGDKVALEAMACGRPCLLANEGFRETLGEDAPGLVFPWGDAETLAERLRGVLEMEAGEREALGLRLRRRVAEAHGLERLMDRLAALLAAVAGRNG